MSLQEISFHTEMFEKIYIVSVQGSIDSFTGEKFVETLRGINEKGPVIINLEGVQTVSSTGIHFFKKLAEVSYTTKNIIVLVNMSQSVRYVFNSGNIQYSFHIAENEDEAVKVISRIKK